MENPSIDDRILQDLKNADILNTLEYAAHLNIPHDSLYGILNSLERDFYITLQSKDQSNQKLQKNFYVFSPEAEEFLQKGSYEFRAYTAIPENGISKEELKQKLGFDDDQFNKAQINGMSKKIFGLNDTKTLYIKKQENVSDTDTIDLKKAFEQKDKKIDDAIFKSLNKRKLVTEKQIAYFQVFKGSQYKEKRVKLESEVTSEMITSGKWKTSHFKKYNWESLGKEIKSGNLHPLMKVRKQMREVLLEMGFEEMPTNSFVESSFYNFDALFVPQNHPARDEQDTFFVSDPEYADIIDQDYMKKVKEIHETGGYGSIGYRYKWQESESQRNVFRTHTTAVTAKMLRLLAKETQENGFKPRKMFSIDRVFRNESLDATHLAEFNQIEGLVAEENVGLAHLIGIFTLFFQKIGITKLYFKPTYNPYTEPSLEIHGWHPVLNKMVEVGNSGVFRPEMLRPMGLPENVNVLGWGLGLERPTMIQYGYNNIRELFGYKVDLKMVKKNAITAFK